MLANSKWIGLVKGEDSPFKTEPYSKEREAYYKDIINPERGSLLFRKSFTLTGKPVKAKLAISGLGYYEVFVNGKKPDENRVFAPVVSDYFKMVRYDTYDVAELLSEGGNTLVAEVGPGWFSPWQKYWGWQYTWYGNPRLIAELILTYADGSEEIVTSDESWKITHGAIVSTDIYDGEKCDFRLERKDRFNFDCDETGWSSAVEVNAPCDRLEELSAEPIRVIRTLPSVSRKQLAENLFVFDFGENTAGIPAVTVKGKEGDVVVFRHAEYLNPDGTLNINSNGNALVVDEFILSDDTPTLCCPRFTYHGFRYMTVEVPSADCEIISAEKRVIHSDVRTIGQFRCGDDSLNRLHEINVRSALACMQGVPVDCPQRQERKSWLGDIVAASEYCLYNFDLKKLFASLLHDIDISRAEGDGYVVFIAANYNIDTTVVNGEKTSIDWTLAYPVIILEHYERYGDKSILERHFTPLSEHSEYYISQIQDGLIPFCWFGDWLSVDYENDEINLIGFTAGDDNHPQNPPYAATMFLCTTLRILAKIGEIIGKDVGRYTEKREECIRGIRAKYYNSEKAILGGGSQFPLIYGLYEHIIPEEDRERAFANLLTLLEKHNYSMRVGIFGRRLLFDLLDEFGRRDIIDKIFAAEGKYTLREALENDCTTLNELPYGGGSGCHFMWGSADASFYKVFGGITIDRTQAHAVTIKPYFDKKLGFVDCSQEIEEGVVSVKWKETDDGFELKIETPCDTVLILPDREPQIIHTGAYQFKVKI